MERDLRFASSLVFLTSFSLLCYEIILTRLFSILQWQNLSSVIISLALLGFGVSGTFLTLFKSSAERHYPLFFLGSLFLFPFTLFLGFVAFCRTPFNPFTFIIDRCQWFYLFIYFASTTIPFFFAATPIGLALIRFPAGIIYWMSLAGSGTGAIAIILLSSVLAPDRILLLLTALSLLAAVIGSLNYSRRLWIPLLLTSLLLLSAFNFAFERLDSRQASPYKSLSRTLRLPGARIIGERYSSLGLVQAVEAEGLHYSGDLSLLSPYQVPTQKAIFFDGDSMSPVIPFTGRLEDIGYLDYTPSSLPHHLLSPDWRQKALIIGAGGGEGILKALFHHFSSIDGVEINGDVIHLMRGELAGFSGGIYAHPQVRIFHREARGFLSSTRERYNLIELSLTDSYAAAASGIYGLNESYLYTLESIQRFYQHLAPEGLLAITRWNVTPPRDNIKMANLCIAALKGVGVRDVVRHIFYIRSLRASTIVVSRTPLTTAQIGRGKAFAEDRLFDLVQYPGMKPQEGNRHIKMDPPLYEEAAQSLLSEKSDAFVRDYAFDISVPTDNRPYFYNFFRWRTLSLLIQAGSQRIPFTEWGYFTLILFLIPTLIISFSLILLPLLLTRFRGIRHHLTISIYFALVGIGFFFIEMPLIQKFILFLHHPTYSLSVILSSLLLSSGLGSYFSDRVLPPRYRIFLASLILIGILLIYSWFLDPVMRVLSPWSEWAKISITILLIMPLGFFMGIPFPQGLCWLKRQEAALVPWAWGINGFFSVISVILAHILAIQWGFSMVLLLSGLCYLAAGALSFHLTK